MALVRLPTGTRDFFLYSTAFRPALGPTQSVIQCVLEFLSSGIKWQKLEADQLPLSSVISPFPHKCPCHGAYLNKHRDSFIFTCDDLHKQRVAEG